jgi:hypothetical protein
MRPGPFTPHIGERGLFAPVINRLAEGGRLPDMRALVERYGLRARLQDLEGLQRLPSGFLSSPRLVAER